MVFLPFLARRTFAATAQAAAQQAAAAAQGATQNIDLSSTGKNVTKGFNTFLQTAKEATGRAQEDDVTELPQGEAPFHLSLLTGREAEFGSFEAFSSRRSQAARPSLQDGARRIRQRARNPRVGTGRRDCDKIIGSFFAKQTD